MTPREILDSFAAVCDIRKYLEAPWREGAFVYATNGHWGVRMPAADFPEVPLRTREHPNVAKLLAGLRVGEYTPIATEVPAQACDCCKGRGHTRQGEECPSCEGKGEFGHFGRAYHCDFCDGHGKVTGPDPEALARCECCHGTGFAFGSGVEPVKVGHQHFQAGYIAHLKGLPGLEFANAIPNSGTHGAAFRFQGGDGVIMPLDPRKIVVAQTI